MCGCCGLALARLDEEAEEEVEVRGWDSTFSLWVVVSLVVLSSLDQGRGFSSFHSAALCMFVGGSGSCCRGGRCVVCLVVCLGVAGVLKWVWLALPRVYRYSTLSQPAGRDKMVLVITWTETWTGST